MSSIFLLILQALRGLLQKRCWSQVTRACFDSPFLSSFFLKLGGFTPKKVVWSNTIGEARRCKLNQHLVKISSSLWKGSCLSLQGQKLRSKTRCGFPSKQYCRVKILLYHQCCFWNLNTELGRHAGHLQSRLSELIAHYLLLTLSLIR